MEMKENSNLPIKKHFIWREKYVEQLKEQKKEIVEVARRLKLDIDDPSTINWERVAHLVRLIEESLASDTVQILRVSKPDEYESEDEKENRILSDKFASRTATPESEYVEYELDSPEKAIQKMIAKGWFENENS